MLTAAELGGELYFGDASQPFGPGVSPHPHYAYGPRDLAQVIIEFMTHFQSQVRVSTDEPNRTVRTLRLFASAPYVPHLGMFVNHSDLPTDQDLSSRRDEPVILDIGDAVSKGRIVRRWVRLSRPSGMAFGVGSVSRPLPGGPGYDRWVALTVSIGAEDGIATPALWAQTGFDVTTRLAEIDDFAQQQFYNGHFRALGVALSRTVSRHRNLGQRAVLFTEDAIASVYDRGM